MTEHVLGKPVSLKKNLTFPERDAHTHHYLGINAGGVAVERNE